MNVNVLDTQISEAIAGAERVVSGSVFYGREVTAHIESELRSIAILQCQLISKLHGIHGLVSNCDQR